MIPKDYKLARFESINEAERIFQTLLENHYPNGFGVSHEDPEDCFRISEETTEFLKEVKIEFTYI